MNVEAFSPSLLASLGGLDQLASLSKRIDDLLTLGGEEKIRGMLQRFSGHLQEVLDRPDQDMISNAHRIVGLGGVLGFGHIEQTWRALESEGASADQILAARSAALGAIAFVDDWR